MRYGKSSPCVWACPQSTVLVVAPVSIPIPPYFICTINVAISILYRELTSLQVIPNTYWFPAVVQSSRHDMYSAIKRSGWTSNEICDFRIVPSWTILEFASLFRIVPSWTALEFASSLRLGVLLLLQPAASSLSSFIRRFFIRMLSFE